MTKHVTEEDQAIEAEAEDDFAGAEGDQSGAGSFNEVTGDPTLLSVETVMRIGERLFGLHWQADFAREIGLSKSQINRILRGSRQMPPDFPVRLRSVVVKKIQELVVLLDSEGMPFAGTEEIQTAIGLVFEASAIFRGEAPTRK